MYRHQTRIPTLVALFILLFGIGGGILLIETSRQLTTSADASTIPRNIHITNISDTQFTVSWLTDKTTTGYIQYSDTSSADLVAFDDRDVDGNSKKYITHHITVTSLKENTLYSFKIVSGNTIFDNQGQSFQQSTGPKLSSSVPLDPSYGLILQVDDKPAEGAIVYLTVGKSLPLSTLVKSEGTWLIPLTIIRTQDLLSRPTIGNPEVIQITVLYDQKQSASATTDTKASSPVPSINLGKTYDFRNLQGKKGDFLAQKEKPNVLGVNTISITPVSSPKPSVSFIKVDILFPDKDAATTIDSKPLIKGIGIPGSQVVVTVNSTPQVGRVSVANDGSWSFIPPSPLPPGNHTVSITTTDANGHTVTRTKKFIVLKSGESVLGESTPSASLTPFLSPTEVPLLTPLVTYGPSVTTSPPVTGSISPTITFLGLGIIFVLVGLKFILLP